MSENKNINILIIEDSVFMRRFLRRILTENREITIVGEAANGREALGIIPNAKPDVILLDLEMPIMNGIEFLKEFNNLYSIPVIVCSAFAERGAKITIEAFELGIFDVIHKPEGDSEHSAESIKGKLLELISAATLSGKSTDLLKAPLLPSTPEISLSVLRQRLYGRDTGAILPAHRPDAVVVGVSTGGPGALRVLLKDIPEDFSLPILIVQHMPAPFTKEFAASIDRSIPLNAKEAKNGEEIKRGWVYIAPGGRQMKVARVGASAKIVLSDEVWKNGHKPSADLLFESSYEVYGKYLLAVIMTGMGSDGTEKLSDIYHGDGIVLGQDEKTSIVYGMPRAAMEAGVVHRELPLEMIAPAICDICRKR